MSSTSTAVAPSLFEQLGGAAGIEAAVEDFYARVLADDTLRPIFAGIDLEHLRAVAAHLDASLGSFEVPRHLIAQVIAHVASLRDDVIEC